MAILFTDNAWAFLQSAISATTTTLELQDPGSSTTDGGIQLFPNIVAGSGDVFFVTIMQPDNTTHFEILKVTSINKSTRVLTVTRGQQGTTPREWEAGARVELRWTADQAYFAANPALPLHHASTHATGGSDPITAASIGAAASTVAINTTLPLIGGGTLNTSRTLSINPATAGSAGAMSATDKAKLDGIASGAQVNTVSSVNGKMGTVVLTPADIGMSGSYLPLTGGTMTGNITMSGTSSLLGNASTSTYFKIVGIGGDLDTYTTPGMYYINQTTSTTHNPLNGSRSFLEVAASGGIIIQRLYGIGSDSIWKRITVSGSLVGSSWINLVETSINTVNIYVSADSGDDSGFGTQVAPYKTINRALKRISNMNVAGGINLYLMPGTYSEAVTIRGSILDGMAPVITIRSSDTNNKALCTGVFTIENARIQLYDINFSNDSVCLLLQNNSYASVSNCSFTGTSTSAYGMLIRRASTVELTGTTYSFSGSFARGIQIGGNSALVHIGSEANTFSFSSASFGVFFETAFQNNTVHLRGWPTIAGTFTGKKYSFSSGTFSNWPLSKWDTLPGTVAGTSDTSNAILAVGSVVSGGDGVTKTGYTLHDGRDILDLLGAKAYGVISPNGTIISGTNIVSCIHTNTGRYEINLTPGVFSDVNKMETYVNGNSTLMTTLTSGNSLSTTKITATTLNGAGAWADAAFVFRVFEGF